MTLYSKNSKTHQSGHALVEYALIVGMITIISSAAILAFGENFESDLVALNSMIESTAAGGGTSSTISPNNDPTSGMVPISGYAEIPSPPPPSFILEN